MYYQNFINIKREFLLSDSEYEKSKDVFKRLKPSDTLTTGVYSRKTDLPFELAEKVLIECVNLGLLNMLILVPCNVDFEHAPLVFNSLKEFSVASSTPELFVCQTCGISFDFANPLVAFKRPNKVKKVQ